jgi:hypothetical protein
MVVYAVDPESWPLVVCAKDENDIRIQVLCDLACHVGADEVFIQLVCLA